MIRILSSGIRKIRYLNAFIDEELRAYSGQGCDAVIGWGHKPTAKKARDLAKKKNLPYIALEDGFLRSVGLGLCGAAPISLIVDPVGVYYDAKEPSAVENDIQNFPQWMNESLRERARTLIRQIVDWDLSKYNNAPAVSLQWLEENYPQSKGKKKILLVDQTKADASVDLGLADAKTFERMLADAKKDHPEGAVFIKTHPDVIAGKKEGYLSQRQGVCLLDQEASPLSLISNFDEVYVVTSQMGLEALFLGKMVHVYGMPFYAGWGLTDDRAVPCPRRTAQVSLEVIFAAAYIRNARYVNPVDGQRIEIEDALDILVTQKRFNDQNRGSFMCAGIRRWKQPHLRAFLASSDNEIEFVWDFEKALKLAKHKSAKLVVWASKCTQNMLFKAQMIGLDVIRVEDGFLRSIGLGSDYATPWSLVFDHSGIYYDPAHECDLEKILNDIALHPERYIREMQRAHALREVIVGHNITKYNTADTGLLPELPTDKKVILVTGQVDGDASVRSGGWLIQTNRALLQRVRELNPEAYIVYLEHPDVASGNRPGALTQEEKTNLADCVVSGISVHRFIGRIDELHTLTSLSGFEALLRGIRVVTYGKPFYAGWGLTKDVLCFERRMAKLSLEGLIAGTLICYPKYWDWRSKCPCRPEDVCQRVIEKIQPKPALWVSLVKKFRDLKRGFL